MLFGASPGFAADLRMAALARFMRTTLLAPASMFSKIAETGIRVPLRTQAPLTLPGAIALLEIFLEAYARRYANLLTPQVGEQILERAREISHHHPKSLLSSTQIEMKRFKSWDEGFLR